MNEAPPAPARTRWLAVALLVGAGIACAFEIGKVPVALPALGAELRLGLVVQGWIISMFNVLGAVAGVLVGAGADRLGPRRAVLLGLCAVAAASALGAAAEGAAMLLLTRFLEGLGFIMVVTAVPGLLVRASRIEDQRLAFGYWSCYMPAGTALMMAMAPLILAPFGWRGLWLTNGLLLLAAAVAVAAATRGLAPRSAPGRGLRAVLADIAITVTRPGPALLALAFASYTLQYLSVLSFLPTLLVQNFAISSARAASLTALAVAINVTGNLAGGYLLHRGWPRWLLLAAGSVAMGLASLAIYAPALPFATRYGVVLAFSSLGGIIPPAVLGGVAIHAPRPALIGTASGLLMQGSNLGQSIGPPALAALAFARGGWQWSPIILTLAAATGLALALMLRRLERMPGRGDIRSD